MLPLISGEISCVFCPPRCQTLSRCLAHFSVIDISHLKPLATENWLTCYLPLQLTSNTISPNLRTQLNFHYYLGMQCQAEPSNLEVFSVLASRCPSCPIFLTLSHLLTKRITRSLESLLISITLLVVYWRYAQVVELPLQEHMCGVTVSVPYDKSQDIILLISWRY